MIILIVEDDSDLAELIKEKIILCGYDCFCIYNSKNSIEWLEHNNPDLMILDYSLPDMNAKEMLAELCAKNINIPAFIISTGKGDEKTAVEMMKLGAIDYIVKDMYFLDMLPGVITRAVKEIENEKKLNKAEEEKEKLYKQLLHAQKMESIGRLAGGVAHDFNNILAAILGCAELALLSTDENHSAYEYLEQIIKITDRSAELNRQLLAFARKQDVNPIVIDINETISKMIRMLYRFIGEHIEIVWKPGDSVWSVNIDPYQIDQIFANLCVNARDAISGNGKIILKTKNCFINENSFSDFSTGLTGDFVCISISDNGVGIDKEILPHIFEPFFTTKESGKGTGLGLASVYGVVKQNGGFITVESELGKGTSFYIYLPKYESIEKNTVDTQTVKQIFTGRETILLVEDQIELLNTTELMLKKMGYCVLSADNPISALEIASNNNNKINLLLTDIMMPEMNGKELYYKIKELYPDIKFLFMSGYTGDVLSKDRLIDKEFHFIQKPFTMTEFSKKVKKAFEK